MEKNKLKKYIVLVLILIALILSCIFIQKQNNSSKIQKIGDAGGASLNLVGSINVDTNKTISINPNEPKLGAGMIPIKYKDGSWQITTVDDADWYDYSSGKMATVMLSDGYYKSEPQYGIDEDKQLAEKHIGGQVLDNIGTIFVWVPRLIYTDTEIMYLRNTSIFETDKISLPTCFTYKTKNQPELAFEGIWVEQTPEDTKTLTASKITDMSKETNTYGLIKNEVLEIINGSAVRVAKKIQDGKNAKEQQIKSIDNTNRVMLRIINTNNNTPIIVNSYTAEKKAYINVTYSEFGIKQIVSMDNGAVLSNYSLNAEMSTPENGIYTFAIIDVEGNVKITTVQVGDGTPELIGYKVNTTYIVMYSFDEQGNATEISTVPIQDILKEGFETDANNALTKGTIDFKKVAAKESEYNARWYAYEEQKWANIVTRNNANVAYFTWIPRYVYQLDNENESTRITFVNTNNEDKSGNEVDLNEWILPDAFTWVNLDGESVPISGYWIGKYALTSGVSINIQANIVGGINNIRVNNITNASGLSDVKYDIYLYDAGEDNKNILSAKTNTQVEKTKVAPDDEVDLIGDAVNGGSYMFNKSVKTDNNDEYTLEVGNYAIRIVLKDSAGTYRGEAWFTTDVIDTAATAEIPDLTGYRVNTTYIVTYIDPNDANTMDASIPISSILSDGYEVDPVTNTLTNGHVDENKVNAVLNGTNRVWYDYNTQKWANIVVRNAGSESYYTWIPRYAYKLDNIDELTQIKFITINDEVPEGWTLPDAFSWVDVDGITKPLNGYWIGKYALTNATDLQFKIDNGDKVIGGTNKLIINNVSCTLSDITYNIYVYDHKKALTDEFFAEPETTPGEKRAFNDYDCTNNRYVRYAEMKPSDTKSIIFYDLDESTYDIRIVAYDNRGYYRAEKWWKNIAVIEEVDSGRIDVNDVIRPGLIDAVHTGFNQSVTYYVSYDSNNNEILTPVTQNPPADWFDYAKQKWANIVVKGNGKTAYFTYIPRYVYKLDEVRQATEIKYIRVGDTIPAGWTLPDAFKWVDLSDETKQLEGYWMGKYAVSN